MTFSESHASSIILRKACLFALMQLCFLTGCRPTAKLHEPQVVSGPVRQNTSNAETAASATPEPAETLMKSPTPSATVEPTMPMLFISYDVPVLSQEGLLLNGSKTGVGCIPVCIEMITSWWNSTNETFPILKAQEVIDRNAEQGLYVAGRGMSSASAADELAEIGYKHAMILNSSKEELLEALESQGPLGVLVKTNWIPTTMNHAAVLTSYDQATDTVTLNDPFYGSSVSWTWEAFDGIWGLNYAGDKDYEGTVVRRIFFTIIPESTVR